MMCGPVVSPAARERRPAWREPMDRPDSAQTALEINLKRTAAEIEIPDEHLVLLEATRGSVGVYQKTAALLDEVNHPFANWFDVLQDLRAYGIDNFYYHNTYEKGDKAIAVIVSIFFLVVKCARRDVLRHDAVRTLLRYLEKVAVESDNHFARNRPVVEDALRKVEELFATNREFASLLSGPVRRLVRRMLDSGREWDDELLRLVLSRSLKSTWRAWLERPDPTDWIIRDGVAGTPSLDGIGHESFRAHLDDLESSRPGVALLAKSVERYPDQARIEKLYLAAADEVGAAEKGWELHTKKVLFLLKILDTPALRRIHDTTLRSINRSLSRALLLDERPDADRFISEVFASFRKGWMQHDTTVLDCIHTIALDVLRSGDDGMIQQVIDHIIAHGFEEPEIRGVNELWQYETNPAHAKNIRLWIDLIVADPVRMKRLLVALIAHLRIGGVFLSDTDLFQKDMANLLNAPIGPVYNLVKQLGRLLPIYFTEIGAEGRIRDVSTRLDELGKRQDKLIHFLRKQCHVESSSRLLPFVEAILKFWATGDKGPLRAFLPTEVFNGIDTNNDHFREMHELVVNVARAGGRFPDDLIGEDAATAEAMIDRAGSGSTRAIEKGKLLLRLYFLLDAKYSIGPRGVMEEILGSRLVDHSEATLLHAALEEGDHLKCLDHLIPILEGLKEIILDPEEAESREDIYHKRHIAAGIPSMYGRFLNRKLEALGLSFRIESLGSVLFEKLLEEENLHYMTRRGIGRILHWLVLFQRGLVVDGISAKELAGRHAMLKSGITLGDLTIDQFVNIFQFTSRTLREIIRDEIVGVFERDMTGIVRQYVDDGEATAAEITEKGHMVFEGFLRDQISTCFALQPLDNLVTAILHTLQYEAETFNKPIRNLLMSFDIDKCFAPIFGKNVPHDDPIFFGHKGFGLRRMAEKDYPVPAGFIITTEVYRCYQALLEFGELRYHGIEVMRKLLDQVERQTGKKLGDPDNPLLLSVRSGSAISMPGILDTFLNVGINEEIAEGQSKLDRFAWAAWDNYRRFLQCWGLSFGVPQDVFDRIFDEYKQKYSIPKKRYFSDEQIREVALASRQAILDHGVELIEDPFRQLRYCIDRVLDSWNGERALVYRKEMKIAPDWGTAVVVQSMVYGNMDEHSGTGVIFTRNPRVKAADVSLYGDFVLRSQGEDVVRGLVETFPISEEQRITDGIEEKESLETLYPDVYGELLRIAKELVDVHGLPHQEVEFTFENEHASSLYLLQAREILSADTVEVAAFVPTEELESSYLASGIGVGGGALSGVVAHTQEDIHLFRKKYPDKKIILIRPNTVPDDMHLIFLSDGLLTSRGGCTSHAAVAAQRIGRTCVVGCRNLQVDEEARTTTLGKYVLRSGDFIGINGFDGSVYLNEHEIKLTRRLSGL